MKKMEIIGIPLFYFVAVVVVLFAGIFLGVIPLGMIGAFLILMVFGAILNIIGDNLPIIKSYLGGGPIVIIFSSAALVYFKILPDTVIKSIVGFMKSGVYRETGGAIIGYKAGFLDFYIAALITGSILGMHRKLLIKAAIRFIPAILGGVLVALGFVSIVGAIIGFGAREALTLIGIPIVGGGMGAGAVPLSQIFSKGWNIDTQEILSKLVPAVALGNAFAIVAGGLLDKLGKKYPTLTGNGKLMDIDDDFAESDEKIEYLPKDYGVGIVLATSFFVIGTIVSKFIPIIHSYAWMILTVGIVKALGLFSRDIEIKCRGWYQFVAGNFTSALLFGIGVAYTDLGKVINSFSFTYIVLVAITVIGVLIGSMLVGKLVGFYPIEAGITAGLCMANMGGTGDVAVLGAAKRMELMPFAQISSRIGGSIILLLASFIVLIF